MPQPAAYSPSTNFAADELANAGGRSTVRTAALDGELAGIATTLAGVRTNLALNQRDDGEIRDQRVKLHTLASDVRALLAAGQGLPRGDWVTATAYAVRDVVTQGGNTYICATAHTSGTFATDLSASRWLLFALGAAASAASTPFTATATISATDVQAAIEESDTEGRALSASLVAALAADLASTNNAAKGAGQSGYASGLAYGDSTVGKKLQEIRSAYDYGARGASTVTDTAAINAGIADLHNNFGGGVLKLNAFISTAIDLTTLTNQPDVILYDERYRAAGHVGWFNTGTDTEMRVHGASTSSGEGPSFVVQNNATAGNRTGSFVARYGPMGSTKVNSYFHFGVWDGAAWTPDLDWLGNGNFGGVDDFRSRFRLGAAGALILNPAGTGKNIDAAAAKAAGYTLVVNRPTPPGGGALQYQFGIRDGAIECPQEVQIYAANAAIRFQNAAQANKWAFLSEFPGAGQFSLYDHTAGVVKQSWTTGGDVLVAGNHAPTTDNTVSSGKSSNRWSVVYAGTGAINTSDEREKEQIGPIPNTWLDAWAEVDWCRFKFRDAVQSKGDGARWHVGLVAQRVDDAFSRHGLDAREIGLLCYDEWPEEWLDHPAEFRDSTVLDENGAAIRVLVKDAWREKVREAGNRWGIRYDEAMAMECAYLRWRADGGV